MTLELRVREILGGAIGRPLSLVSDADLLAELLPSAILCEEVRDELEEAFCVPLSVEDLNCLHGPVGDVVRLLRRLGGE